MLVRIGSIGSEARADRAARRRLAAPRPLRPRRHSSATTVKIGWITGLTGTQATNSAAGDAGHGRRAQSDQQHRAAGKGIKFQMVEKDDAATPQVASQRCNELVNQTTSTQ